MSFFIDVHVYICVYVEINTHSTYRKALAASTSAPPPMWETAKVTRVRRYICMYASVLVDACLNTNIYICVARVVCVCVLAGAIPQDRVPEAFSGVLPCDRSVPSPLDSPTAAFHAVCLQ
jgi:hypothetical protein